MLISLDEAVDHLRLYGTPSDLGDIARKKEEAEAIVLDYVNDENKLTWDQQTCPLAVKSAVKLVLGSIYDGNEEPFSDGAKNLVRVYRDPPLS